MFYNYYNYHNYHNYHSLASYINMVSLANNRWHHVCMSWTSTDGKYCLYTDGINRGCAGNVTIGAVVEAGGVFTPGGCVGCTSNFVGKLSHFNVWSEALELREIAIMSRGCYSYADGDIVKWSKFRDHLFGGVTVTEPAHCTLPGT